MRRSHRQCNVKSEYHHHYGYTIDCRDGLCIRYCYHLASCPWLAWTSCIDLLPKYKCDTNCKDSSGHTPLHHAIRNNHLEVVKYFISEQHCDPMTRDNNGDTPLHIACGCRHTHIVQYLLSTGKVHILTKNKYGKTPMDKIVSSNQSFELFKSDKSTTLLHLAAAHGWIDTVIDLIKKYKCDTNSKDTFGNTPIHYAASNNHLEVVKYLIREGHCNLSCKNNDGDTPLHIACRCDHR